jgi:hypothetical protein
MTDLVQTTQKIGVLWGCFAKEEVEHQDRTE